MAKHLAVAIARVALLTVGTALVACVDGGHDSLAPGTAVVQQPSVPQMGVDTSSGRKPHGGSRNYAFQARPDSVGAVPQLLTCLANHSTETGSQVVGPAGGIIPFGMNALLIPPGALETTVTITATAPAGQVLVAQFQPQGLTFEVPAQVVLSYQGCTLPDSTVHVDYVNDSLTKVLEIEPSTIQVINQLIVAPITHFSVYAAAE